RDLIVTGVQTCALPISTDRTARKGVTGNPCCARKVFSRRRFWVVWSTSPAGRTSARSAAACAVAAGTFSNSKVTTDTFDAKARKIGRASCRERGGGAEG